VEFDAQKQAGTFKGDVLIAALGKEHPGRTRGVGVYAPWKTGRNWDLEKKREAKKARKEEEKAEMVKAIREQVMKELCEKFRMEPQPSGPSLDVTPDTEELGHELPPSLPSLDVTPDTDTSYPCDHIEVINY
jgi:hypothetical protein